LERQQANVVRELREYRPVGDEDIDQQWRGQLRDGFAETQLADLTDQKETVTSLNPALLNRLPIVQADLSRLPEDLERELFGAFQLQVRYHQPTRRVTLRASIDERALRQLIATTGKIVNQDPPGAAQETNGEPSSTAVGGGSVGFPLQ
jgi:site-specific DNA recombinase